jgi:hypothetical protein
MNDGDETLLARRYRRLMVAYPADYRARRGDEIVGLALDLARPGQRRPRAGEAADLIAGGVRHRWGMANAWDFADSLAVAGPVALALAAGLSGFLWLTVEPLPTGHGFLTTGPIAYAAWLFAALAWAVLPVRVARVAIGAAALATAALIPLASVGQHPPLWTIMALVGFGALAIVAPRRTEGLARFGVLVGASVVAAVAKLLLTYWLPPDAWWTGYYTPALYLAGVVVAMMVLAVAGVGIVVAFRGGRVRPLLWAALLLALPGGWLGPLSNAAGDASQFGRLAEVLLATCVVSAAVLALRSVPADRVGGVGRVGPVAVGFAAGLAGFLTVFGALHGIAATLAWSGVALAWRWLPTPLRRLTIAGAAAVTVATASEPASALPVTFLLLALVAFLCPGGRDWTVPTVGVAVLAGATLVASYDNDWRWYAWPHSTHTTALVLDLAMVPFTVAVLAGARAARIPGSRLVGVTIALVGAGWIAGRTVPDLLFWAPSLLLLPVGALVLIVLRVFRRDDLLIPA